MNQEQVGELIYRDMTRVVTRHEVQRLIGTRLILERVGRRKCVVEAPIVSEAEYASFILDIKMLS